MSFDEEKQPSRVFLAGLLLFIGLIAAVFFYFSGRDVAVEQKLVEVAVPLPSDQVAGQGIVNPDTAPPVTPKGTPSFAVPAEEPKPFAPLPVKEPVAGAETTTSDAAKTGGAE